MLFQRIKRTDPERVFGIFKNNEASTTLVDGDVVIHDVTPADGVSVLKSPATALLVTVAGVAAGNDIVPGDYGTIQVYGYHGNVKSSGATASTGMATIATAGTATAASAATDLPLTHFALALTATASGRNKAIIRCM